MLPFRYLFREGFLSVRRTPVASAVTVLTIVMALVLIGGFWYVSLNLEALVSSMRTQVELEAFLQMPQASDLEALRANMIGVQGVDSVHFVSSEEAAQVFQQQTGERVTSLLDTNPFPPSFRIALRSGYSVTALVEKIARSVESLSGVDTVVYRAELVNRIEVIAETTRSVGLLGGGIILFIALLLTANTIRLAIYAKRNLIRTLQLVGATKAFIRIPFLLEGIAHGLLGGALAAGVLALGVVAIRQVLPAASILTPPLISYAIIAAVGVALGFAGSVVSAMRFVTRSH